MIRRALMLLAFVLVLACVSTVQTPAEDSAMYGYDAPVNVVQTANDPPAAPTTPATTQRSAAPSARPAATTFSADGRRVSGFVLAAKGPSSIRSVLRRIGRDERGGTSSTPGDPFRGRSAPARSYKHLDDNHGVKPHVASNRLHKLKEQGGLRPDDDVVIGRNGDVYDAATEERLGTLTDKSLGS